MPYVDKITVNDTTYDIRDTTTAEEVSDLKSDLNTGNAENVVKGSARTSSYNGIQYTCDSHGNLHMEGTSTAGSFFDFYASEDNMPSGIKAGGTYAYKFESTNTNITLRIYVYDNGSLILLGYFRGDGTIEIPDSANGLILRVGVPSGVTVNETVSPKLWTNYPNYMLENEIYPNIEKITSFHSWTKGVTNADGTINTSYNGAVSTKEIFYEDTTVKIKGEAQCVVSFFDGAGIYIGKIASDETINKTSGNWKYFNRDAVMKPSTYAPDNAVYFRISNLPTDGTTITADNCIAWANAHSELVYFVDDIVCNDTRLIEADGTEVVRIAWRNGSVNNMANASGISPSVVIPTEGIDYFRIELDGSYLSSDDYYVVQVTSFTVDSGRTAYSETSSYRVQADATHNLLPGQTVYYMPVLKNSGVKSIAFALYHRDSGDNYIPIRIENVDTKTFAKVTAYHFKSNDYAVDSNLIKHPVTLEAIAGLQYIQSFCVYNGYYFSTDGSNIAKQTIAGSDISTTALSVGHGNSFQLGHSNIAYISGWDDDKVYAVNLDTITISQTYALPVSGYTTCAVDDVNQVMYIFHRTTIPTTEEYYNFVVYDYANNQIVSQKKTTNKFGAMQACDFVDGKIFVVYGLGTEAVPSGFVVYNTNGDIISHFELERFKNKELEGVCYDRTTKTLLLSDVSKTVYSITGF